MHNFHKLLTIILTCTFAFNAWSEEASNFTRKKQLMAIEAEINAINQTGASFFESRYLDLLNQYNLARLSDFHRVYGYLDNSLASYYERYAAITQKLGAIEGNVVQTEKDQRVNAANKLYLQYETELSKSDGLILELDQKVLELQAFREAWLQRSSPEIIKRHEEFLGFSEILHEPLVDADGGSWAYGFRIEGGYLGSPTNLSASSYNISATYGPVNILMTLVDNVFRVTFGGSDSQASLIAAAITFFVGGFEAMDHEDKVYDRIISIRKANQAARATVDARQSEIIKKSLDMMLVKQLDDGITFDEAIDDLLVSYQELSAQLKNKKSAAEANYKMGYEEFMRQLKTLANAEPLFLVEQRMKISAAAKESIALFNSTEKTTLANKSIGKQNMTPDGKYAVLLDSVQDDAKFSEAYLTGLVFRDTKDFYFNETRLHADVFPLGPWLDRIRKIHQTMKETE